MPFTKPRIKQPLGAAHRTTTIFAAILAALSLVACSANDTKGPVTTTDSNTVVVHKSPFCLCCKSWMAHLEDNGFSVISENSLDTAEIKVSHDVPASLQGCHTGVVNGRYVFEGHVPARLIRRYLANPPPNSIGLAVPGMPQGSPGMYRGKDFAPYDVFLIRPGGDYELYEHISAPETT